MNLFLDANIYLGFYKLSEDDLEELRKLIVAARDGPTNLLLTQQVIDEFERNRESTIAESLRMLDEAKLPSSFPRLFTNYPEYAELRNALRSYGEHRGTLLAKARADALGRDLHADRLIGELFASVGTIPRDPGVEEAAHARVAVGNPPGKGGSLGDAINWEALVRAVPDGEELILVSADKDFASALDIARLNAFLADEWTRRKGTQVEFHRSLTSLFRSRYPDIQLASELERELAVGRLIGSANFASTHAAIRDLSLFTDFTNDQVEALIDAPTRNGQIGRILGDADLQEFFGELLNQHRELLDPEKVQVLEDDLKASADVFLADVNSTGD